VRPPPNLSAEGSVGVGLDFLDVSVDSQSAARGGILELIHAPGPEGLAVDGVVVLRMKSSSAMV
jgi:hypothetical protein